MENLLGTKDVEIRTANRIPALNVYANEILMSSVHEESCFLSSSSIKVISFISFTNTSMKNQMLRSVKLNR